MVPEQTAFAWTALAGVYAALLAGSFLLFNESRKRKNERTKNYRDLERTVSWHVLTATHKAFRQKVGRDNNNVMSQASTEAVVESWAELVASGSRDIVEAGYRYQKAFYDIPVLPAVDSSAAMPLAEIAHYREMRKRYIEVLRAHEDVGSVSDIPNPSVPTEMSITMQGQP